MKARDKAKRPAILYAVMVEVACPFCGEPLPCVYNGSDAWTLEELEKECRAGPVKVLCNSCEEPFLVRSDRKIQGSPERGIDP